MPTIYEAYLRYAGEAGNCRETGAAAGALRLPPGCIHSHRKTAFRKGPMDTEIGKPTSLKMMFTAL
jgi:hypothetical protein